MANEERLEILKMVQEQKISVEDAERLLRALHDGESGPTPPSRPAAGPWLEDEHPLGWGRRGGMHHHDHSHHHRRHRHQEWGRRGGFWERLMGARGMGELRELGQFFREEVERGIWAPLGRPEGVSAAA